MERLGNNWKSDKMRVRKEANHKAQANHSSFPELKDQRVTRRVFEGNIIYKCTVLVFFQKSIYDYWV